MCSRTNRRMVFCGSAIGVNTPRRMGLRGMTEKKPSMALIQQASVRVKKQIQRGWLTWHCIMLGCLWVA
jgi:hypothetical protein